MNQPPLNPDALDHLATVVFGCTLEEWNEHDDDEKRQVLAPYIRTIETYLAVAQPVVNSVEELDALPDKSIVLDADGAACQRNGYGMDGNCWDSMGEEMLSRHIPLPARVLYRPEVKP